MKEVAFARFHQVLEIPGIGSLGNTLPTQAKTLDLKMYHDDDGLLVRIGYRNQINGLVSKSELMIPWANVVICKYSDVAAPVSPLKPVA